MYKTTIKIILLLLQSVTVQAISVTYTHDSLGQIKTARYSNGLEIRYSYDQNGRLLSKENLLFANENQDTDGDGVIDNNDLFPHDPNDSQDRDGDGVGDNADLFPDDINDFQDSDNDGVGDNRDACPQLANDAFEDPCNPDEDGDLIADIDDNCPYTANPDQLDDDGDQIGNDCDICDNNQALCLTTLFKPTIPSNNDFAFRARFGSKIASWGNILAVAVPGDDNEARGINPLINGNVLRDSGAVYIYQKSENNDWSTQAYIKAPNADRFDYFGSDIDLWENTLVVSATHEDNGDSENLLDNSLQHSGAAYVFERDENGQWHETAFLKASNAEAYDFFGGSVSIWGNTIAISAQYERSSPLEGPDDNSLEEAGATYVFEKDENGQWHEVAYLKGSQVESYHLFGIDTTLWGHTLIVSARESQEEWDENDVPPDSRNYESGALYVFERNEAGQWLETDYIKASNYHLYHRFGDSIDLWEDTLVVGAPGEWTGDFENPADNVGIGTGAIYLFTKEADGQWNENAYLRASNHQRLDRFGSSVSLWGNHIIVGAYGEDSHFPDDPHDNFDESSGAAYYIYWNPENSSLEEHSYLKAQHPDSFDYFGFDVSASADSLFVSSERDASCSLQINGDLSDNDCPGKGAVFQFNFND